jgi:hypothetical protein
MSKKNLLQEQTIRRFGGLAGIKPGTTATFLTEEEELEFEEEEEVEIPGEGGIDDVEGELEAAEDDLEDAEIELDDAEDEATDLVVRMADDLAALAGLAGVEVEVGEGGDTDDLGGIEDVEEFAVEDEVGGDFEEEEEEEVDLPLEELINRILAEDDDEDLLEEEEEELEEKKKRKKETARERRYGGGEGDYKLKATGTGHKERAGEGPPDDDGVRHYKNVDEGRVQVVDDEYLMKEVSRRVKARLANLVKEQRRRQRRTKRKK